LVFALTLTHPFPTFVHKFSKILLQICVVVLGFTMNLHEVLKVGRSGFLYTFLSISFVMIVGLTLGRLLSVNRTNSFLIVVGTAICGGSDIAAWGPILEATNEDMSVSLGPVSF